MNKADVGTKREERRKERKGRKPLPIVVIADGRIGVEPIPRQKKSLFCSSQSYSNIIYSVGFSF
jgi:hypothetical protein